MSSYAIECDTKAERRMAFTIIGGLLVLLSGDPRLFTRL
jgi:hypothetical protein